MGKQRLDQPSESVKDSDVEHPVVQEKAAAPSDLFYKQAKDTDR